MIAILLLAALASARLLPEAEYKAQWQSFLATYNRQYASVAEYQHRFAAFCDNLDIITQHNSQPSTYELGVNEFSDLTFEEFSARYLRPVPNAQCSHKFGKRSGIKAPDEQDWVEKGAVTKVKNQGSCGSCYAFSAISAVEGWLAIHHEDLTDISPQMVVDCSSKYGNQGCNGGFMDYVFNYVAGVHGICSEADYPYKGVVQKCKNCTVVPHTDELTGWEAVKTDDEEALLEASAEGVISVAIQATSSFQSYKKGVYTGPCGTNLNHGVTLVGYGTDEKSSKTFWKVKNSWGPGWGESGYIRMARGMTAPHGICGIATCASYPVAKN
jgi:C1A family cysteine protease